MANLCSTCDISILNFVLTYTGKESEQLNFAERHGLLKLRSECGKCSQILTIKQRRTTYIFRCDSRINGQKCAWTRSAVKGTCFEQTRLTLEKVLLFFVYWCKIKNCSQMLICHELEMNYTPFADWSRFCCGVCIDWAWKNSRPLGDEGVVVELYESRRGRGTTVVSDCWRTYACLNDKRFRKLEVDNSLEFVCTADGEGDKLHSANYSLQGLGWRKQHFEGYLSEYLFRSSTSLQNIVHKFLVAVGDLYRP